MTDIEGGSSLVMFSVPGVTEAPAHNEPQPYICIVLSGECHVTRSITDLSLAFISRVNS
jgi:hypothetical protein